jgi:hypothetical protein
MATSAQISITEYLHSTFEPDAEFVNGELEERNVGEYDHNAVQKAILLWFDQHDCRTALKGRNCAFRADLLH